MTIEFEITLTDYISMQKLHTRKSRTLRIAGKSIIAVMALSSFAVWIVDIVTIGWEASKLFLPTVYYAVGIVLFFFIALPLIQRWTYSKTLKGIFPHGTLRYKFSDEGIGATVVNSSESTTLWSAVSKVIEDNKTILIYVAKLSFFAVPKRVLTETTLAELKEILRQNVPTGVKIP